MKFSLNSQQRGRAAVARLAHNQEVAGSSPAPATKFVRTYEPDRTDAASEGWPKGRPSIVKRDMNTASPSRTLAADGGAGCLTSPRPRRPLRSRRRSLSTNRSDARAAGARRRLLPLDARPLFRGPLSKVLNDCLRQHPDPHGRSVACSRTLRFLGSAVPFVHVCLSPMLRASRPVRSSCLEHGGWRNGLVRKSFGEIRNV